MGPQVATIVCETRKSWWARVCAYDVLRGRENRERGPHDEEGVLLSPPHDAHRGARPRAPS